ncbi:MAG: mycothiol synthase [Actinobacteria bacterium 69-20]|nr:mycothiol synthase [Actinomycetota bacterium]OJV26513.1 MAG: mycothiol synthase [Actinobacteria bacterium 69-20]
MTDIPSDVTIGPWRRGLDEGQTAAAQALFARVRAHDSLAPETPPGGDTDVLPAHVAGALVGLAYRRGADPAELYVDPAYRGRGIGRELARATVADITRPSGIWAHGTLPVARHLAAAFGAVPTRELRQLRRSVESLRATPLPVDLPSGVGIRTFRPGVDDDAFLAVNARAFAWHPEQGRLDAAGLRAEMAQPWFDPAGFFLAVTKGNTAGTINTVGTVLGFHWTKVHREETPPLGEVYVLGVDPSSPIKHLGTPLTATGLNHLAARGIDTVLLYVEGDNERAVNLYRRFGFADYAVDTVYAAP